MNWQLGMSGAGTGDRKSGKCSSCRVSAQVESELVELPEEPS